MKKYHIITFGCQMNRSDSESIAVGLEKRNFKSARNMNEADLILVNMCSVRQSAVDRVDGLKSKFAKLKKIKGKKYKTSSPKTILTGCILKSDKKKFSGFFDEILNSKEITKKYSSAKKKNALAYIPISNGCNYSCSYCVVPSTRGRLKCRDHKKILKEAKNAIKSGHKEIWLLGQNVNDYTSPENLSIKFPELLKLAVGIPGKFLIRFMSPNPNNFSDELIDLMANSPKIAKYLNLPLQSGDNKILKAMKRPYTTEQYKKLVEKIRKKIPDINLSTDIIVGFPGETKKQFKNTAKLMKEIKFNIAYILKYSPRPGTDAFKVADNVPVAEKKKRWQILNQIIKEQ